MASCWLMPMPLSVMVSVLAALSKLTRTSRLGASSNSAALFRPLKRAVCRRRPTRWRSAHAGRFPGLEYSWKVGDQVQQLGPSAWERQGLLARGRFSLSVNFWMESQKGAQKITRASPAGVMIYGGVKVSRGRKQPPVSGSAYGFAFNRIRREAADSAVARPAPNDVNDLTGTKASQPSACA